jgi:HNH endonuclease
MADQVLRDWGVSSTKPSSIRAMRKQMGLKSDLLSGTAARGILTQAAHQGPVGAMRAVADLLSTTKLAASKCRGCGVTITPANDSKAHILPNALGGRLKPEGILCRACNSELDRLADNALVNAFGAWPTMLNIPRDHRKHFPKIVLSETGRRVRVTTDGPYTAVDVIYEKAPLESGDTRLSISVPDKKKAKQLAARAAKEFPGPSVDDILKHARIGSLPPEERIDPGVDFGTRAVMGGISTILWLFAHWKEGQAPLSWDGLKSDVVKRQSGAGALRRLIDGLPGLVGPNVPYGHKVVLRSVPRTGELIAYVEIMGVLRVGGLYGKSQSGLTPLIEHIYVYDLDEQRDRSSEFKIDASVFETRDWAIEGLTQEDSDDLRAHYRKVMLDVLEPRYRARVKPADATPAEGQAAPE